MAKTKVSEWSATPASNTDIDGINIAEGCAPSGINDAIRDMMAQIRSWQSGTYGDAFNGPVNGTIGATTPSTGAFTTLSASSTLSVTGVATLGAGAILNTPASVTLTNATGLPLTTGTTGTLATTKGGTGLTSFTANGVVYASSSSALATGSALTFDGTSLGVKAATTEATNVNIGGGRSGNGFAYLDLIGDAAQAASYSARFIRGNGGANATTSLIHKGTGAFEFTASDAGYLTYNINGSEAMRLNSTGLGIGTSSPATKLDVYNSAASGISEIARFRWNNGGTGGAITWANQAGTVLGQIANVTDSGGIALSFYNYNSGTALGERMRLDSSGNLGLGVTPSAWNAGKAFEIGTSVGNAVWGLGANAMSLLSNTYYNSGYKYANNGTATRYDNGGGSGTHAWYTAPSGTAGNAITFTQAMTLDASSNLSIGTTSNLLSAANRVTVSVNGTSSSVIALGVGGTRTGHIYSDTAELAIANNNGASGYIDFQTNGNERARIDSSGNFLVGITASSGTPANGITMVNTTGASAVCIGHSNGTSGGNSYMNFAYNAGTIGSITQSGTTAVLYNLTSDQRLKENITDADSASALIDAIQVRKFDWITDKTHQRYGFIAQELVTVAPEAVHQPADAEEMMAVDYSKLVPMLVKEIQSLRKRLADAGI